MTIKKLRFLAEATVNDYPEESLQRFIEDAIKEIDEIINTTLNPVSVDFIRCGIGGNYGGESYERKREEVLTPIRKLADKHFPQK